MLSVGQGDDVSSVTDDETSGCLAAMSAGVPVSNVVAPVAASNVA
jgi:hypothetical protein